MTVGQMSMPYQNGKFAEFRKNINPESIYNAVRGSARMCKQGPKLTIVHHLPNHPTTLAEISNVK